MSIVVSTPVSQVVAACLAMFFVAAVALKLSSPEPFRRFLVRLGIPERASRIAVGAVIATELLAGVLLLVLPVVGGALTCCLYVAFALAHIRNGSAAQGCGCFGASKATSPEPTEMWRGVALRLVGVAGGGFVVASGTEANVPLVALVWVSAALGLVLWLSRRRSRRLAATPNHGSDAGSGQHALERIPLGWSRRSFLARAALVIGAAMASPLLGIPRRVPAAAAAGNCPLCRGATARCNY